MDVEAGSTKDLWDRFRRPTIVAFAVAITLYVAYAVAHGVAQTTQELRHFAWLMLVPVIALSLINYAGRFLKWAYYLHHLGVRIPLALNAWIYVAGFSMSLTPAKTGEVIKPWAVRRATGTPMATTIPALVADRFTDALAVVTLCALGVGTYAPEHRPMVAATLAALAGVVAVVTFRSAGDLAVRIAGALPGTGGFARWIATGLRALRTCLSLRHLLVTTAISFVAWYAECVALYLVIQGLDVSVDLSVSTFLYTFAMLFGAPAPGGVGMTELALVEGARQFIPHITAGQALAAALIVRVASLWLGVALGAVALLRLERVLHTYAPTSEES